MASQEPKQQNRLMGGEFPRETPYDGPPGQTSAELVHFTCQCGAMFPINVLRSVNVATDREVAEAAVAGNINRAQCPYCSRPAHVEVAYLLHHPHEERFVLVIPEHERHRELKLRAEVLEKVSESTGSAVPAYVSDFQVVFGTEGLRHSLSQPPGHVAAREELATQQRELEERERQAAEVERLHGLRETQLDEKEQAVEQQEESVMMREERIKERGEKLTRMEDDLRQRTAGHQARHDALEVRFQMLEQREAELAKREQAIATAQQTLQDWEAQLRASDQQRDPGAEPLVPPQQTTVTSAPVPEGGHDAHEPAAAPDQDIVTSLMRDPEPDMPSETTQRSRSMTAGLAEHLAEEDVDDAEELTDDDLIEEDDDELLADDLIEGETDLHALPRQRPAQSGASGDTAGPADPAAAVLSNLEKPPPAAPPPAGMTPQAGAGSSPPPSDLAPSISGASDLSPAPQSPAAPSPEPAPDASHPSEPAPTEAAPPAEPEPPTNPYLEPPQHWVRSGDQTMHEVAGGDVYLYARVDEATAEKVKSDTADLWVQFHDMPTYPLIVLTLVLDTTVEDLQALHWFIDIEEDVDRTLLQALRRRFRANVLLYDPEYALLDEVAFEPPREVNVAQVSDRAMQALGEISPSKVSPVQAREQFRTDWDWAGKKRHPYTEDAYAQIDSVEEAKLALGILSYWSEPKNHEYLVLVKSVSVDLLDTITRRILDGAVRNGLWLPQALKERAVALALSVDVPGLVARIIDAFAALGPEPEGLELSDAAENWQRLLRDADEFDVPVSKETVRLAESVIDSANESSEQENQDEAPLELEDLEQASDDELLKLLERRTARKQAALVLAGRGNTDHLEALFRAGRKMGRPDLVAFVPALLGFGESAGDYFVEGLSARKSFTRQACAIALGELKLRRAVVPLLHQLMAEKTPAWTEIARSLGRYGRSGVKPMQRYLRDPRGKEERLVRALAFIAIHGAAKQVEALASNDDSNIAALGAKALESRESARAIEDQVYGQGEIEEQAPLLRFSRRLVQAIAGEEQRDDDELLEELGDSDIMELDEGES